MSNLPTKSRFHESVKTEVVQYRAIEPMAMLCFLFGLLSFMAAFDLVGCFFTVPAMILGLLSLARIKRRPEVFTGRKLALLGLGVSLLFTSTGVARHFTSEYMVRRQAKAIGQEFLELIAHNRPELAFQWSLPPGKRSPADTNPWALYRSNTELADKLREFVDKKDIRALLAIGADAKIYPVGRSKCVDIAGTQSVDQIYAVDFKSDGKTKTFFFGILLRYYTTKSGEPAWRVIDYVGGHDPWKTEASL